MDVDFVRMIRPKSEDSAGSTWFKHFQAMKKGLDILKNG